MMSWFFEKIYKVLIKGRGRRPIWSSIEINGDITTNPNEVQKFIRTYYKNIYFTELENLKCMNEFPDVHDIPILKVRSMT